MIASLWIALGGALGSVARFWGGELLAGISRSFPWGTVFINMSGSFLIAFFGALTLAHGIGRIPVSENVRLFVMVGFCGGFTTFSTFSVQIFEFLRQGAYLKALSNMTLSAFLGILACALGVMLAEKMVGTKEEQQMAQNNHQVEEVLRNKVEDEA